MDLIGHDIDLGFSDTEYGMSVDDILREFASYNTEPSVQSDAEYAPSQRTQHRRSEPEAHRRPDRQKVKPEAPRTVDKSSRERARPERKLKSVPKENAPREREPDPELTQVISPVHEEPMPAPIPAPVKNSIFSVTKRPVLRLIHESERRR